MKLVKILFCDVLLQFGLVFGSNLEPKNKIRKERSAAVLRAERAEAVARNKEAVKAMKPTSIDWNYHSDGNDFGPHATTQMIIDKTLHVQQETENIEKAFYYLRKRKYSALSLQLDEYVVQDIVQSSVNEMIEIIATADDQE